MARDEFLDSLRLAHRSLGPARASTGQGKEADSRVAAAVTSLDLWLTPRSLSGYDPADFSAWPERAELDHEIHEFLAIAKAVPADAPATRRQAKAARQHLSQVLELVGRRVRDEWVGALRRMLREAAEASARKGWVVAWEEKALRESLLGTYKAPCLSVRPAPSLGAALDPVARFGPGHQGVVDLVTERTFETAYFITFKDGRWHMVPSDGDGRGRAFTGETFVNTVSRMTRT